MGQQLVNDPRLGQHVTLHLYPGYTWEVTNAWRWTNGQETLAIDCVQYPDAGFDVPATMCTFLEAQ
jgi:hypothetical protein